MGTNYAPLTEPHDTIVLWCWRGFTGGTNWPRDASLSDSCTLDCCSVLQSGCFLLGGGVLLQDLPDRVWNFYSNLAFNLASRHHGGLIQCPLNSFEHHFEMVLQDLRGVLIREPIQPRDGSLSDSRWNLFHLTRGAKIFTLKLDAFNESLLSS